MGSDKASLVVSGEPLAERAARVLGAATDPVVEVGAGTTTLRAVREHPPGGGPLAAIGAGADALATGGPAVVLACDMPFVTSALIEWLVEHPAPGSVVPVSGQAQPLCARWSAAALASIPALLDRGERSLRALLIFADVTLVGEEEWRSVAATRAFADVDTPADLDRLGGP